MTGQPTVHLGDALDILPTLPDASVDAVVCDPPYEIGVGDQDWDRTGIAFNPAVWTQCLRVLKPGGHLLAFGGTRTYHRMVVAVEDAGFRITDQIDWVYTNGKPKGVDISKGIDRRRDDRDGVLQVTAWLSAQTRQAGWTVARMNQIFGFHPRGKATHWVTQGVAAAVPTPQQWAVLRDAVGFDDTEIRPVVQELWNRKGTVGEAFHRREIVSERHEKPREDGLYLGGYSGPRVKSLAASQKAYRWEGWNTALRPAHDPILLARKSAGFDTLTASVLKRGTGALNIAGRPASGGGYTPNIVLGHDCDGPCQPGCPVAEVGDAARSFPIIRLESRTPTHERLSVNGATHLTPKPLTLMRWLVGLVTPPGGTVLDWCAGSGTTLEAAVIEGFNAIGIEREAPHVELIRARLSKPLEPVLFGDDPAA